MDFALTDIQQILLGTVRKFIADHLQPLEDTVESQGFLADDDARRIQQLSASLGLYALNMPRQVGGGGLSALECMLAEEQFGKTTDILIRRAFGNVYEILLECRGKQRDRWLLPTVRGERTCSIAFTESGAGSDAAGIATTASRQDGKWILNGAKQFISDAEFSDFFVVTAKTGPETERGAISTFLVDKDLDGFDVGPNQPMMGLRGTSHASLHFDNVELTDDHLLGQEGQGLKLALATLGRVRLAQIAARAVGKAAMLLELSLEHARTRKQFGRKIGDFQQVQVMLADSAAEISAARLNLHHAAWLLDRGECHPGKISMVKCQTSEMLGRVADRTVQVFGGSGYDKSLPIERHYRDARVFRIFDGTSEIHRNVLAKGLLADNRSLYDWVH